MTDNLRVDEQPFLAFIVVERFDRDLDRLKDFIRYIWCANEYDWEDLYDYIVDEYEKYLALLRMKQIYNMVFPKYLMN